VRHVVFMEEMRNAYKHSVGKFQGGETPLKYKCRLEDNIKM
jgi:hypothetical protein